MPTEILVKRQSELIKILGAINVLVQSVEWQTLEKLLFSPQLERVDKALLSEAKKAELDTGAIFRLQGERVWAKRYTNLTEYAEMLKKELEGIKIKLQ